MGQLKGFDQAANIILANCEERIFRTTEMVGDQTGDAGEGDGEDKGRKSKKMKTQKDGGIPGHVVVEEDDDDEDSEPAVQMLPLGLFILKGDNVVLVGEVDEVKDSEIDWAGRTTPYPPLPTI